MKLRKNAAIVELPLVTAKGIQRAKVVEKAPAPPHGKKMNKGSVIWDNDVAEVGMTNIGDVVLEYRFAGINCAGSPDRQYNLQFVNIYNGATVATYDCQ
jgi:hypothetical protein